MQGWVAALPVAPCAPWPEGPRGPLPAPHNLKSKCLFIGLAPKCSGWPAQGSLHLRPHLLLFCHFVTQDFSVPRKWQQRLKTACGQERRRRRRRREWASRAAERAPGWGQAGAGSGREVKGGWSLDKEACDAGLGHLSGRGAAAHALAGKGAGAPGSRRLCVPGTGRAGSLSKTLRLQRSDLCARAGRNGSLSDSGKPFSHPPSFPSRCMR